MKEPPTFFSSPLNANQTINRTSKTKSREHSHISEQQENKDYLLPWIVSNKKEVIFIVSEHQLPPKLLIQLTFQFKHGSQPTPQLCVVAESIHIHCPCY